MTDKESFQYNTNNRREKKESILRNILKVKEDINEVDDEIAITDRIEGGSSCETVILDEEFHATRNQEKPSELQQGNFSDDSLDDNVNAAGLSRREKMDNVNYQTNQLSESVISSNLKVGREKSFRKPSMIPKLSRNKLLDNTKTNLLEQKQDFRSSQFSDQRKITSFKTNGKNNNAPLCTGMSNSQADVQPVTLSCLQQKLKATTSIIKQKMEFGSAKDTNGNRNKPKFIQSISSAGLAEPEKPTSANTLGALYKSISQIRESASELSKSDSFKNQKGHIEKLFKHISEIQSIADKLTDIERTQENLKDKTDINSSGTKGRYNKIRIKLTPNIFKKKKLEDLPKVFNKDQKSVPKSLKRKPEDIAGKVADENKNSIFKSFKKKKENILENFREKTHVESTFDQLLKSMNTKDNKMQNNQETENLKEIDSMDGIFIPSCEPPLNIDEEEETDGLEEVTNGLDITITFPKLKNLLYKPVSNTLESSHLGLRLSDISAEAIKTLKRCPKDFTLRMDFLQGRVLLQSGKTVVNNISLGTDVKFAEHSIDEKKSDIISIKPSTECSFTSQLISVDSYKSLKATDSEIFNSINLPLVYKNKSRNTVTIKSCAAFDVNDLWSVTLLKKHNFMSLPEITGLSNTLEDAVMETMSGTDTFQIRHPKRRKNRGKQTKSILSS